MLSKMRWSMKCSRSAVRCGRDAVGAAADDVDRLFCVDERCSGEHAAEDAAEARVITRRPRQRHLRWHLWSRSTSWQLDDDRLVVLLPQTSSSGQKVTVGALAENTKTSATPLARSARILQRPTPSTTCLSPLAGLPPPSRSLRRA